MGSGQWPGCPICSMRPLVRNGAGATTVVLIYDSGLKYLSTHSQSALSASCNFFID
jgi:hypothetical protein